MSKEQDEADAKLLQALYGNPKTRGDLQRIIRKHDPNIPLPELDLEERAAASFEAKLADERKKNEELEKRLSTLEFQNQLKQARTDVRDKYNLSDAEMAEVEKLITEQHFPSHDAAARLLVAERAAAPATPESYFEPPLVGAGMDEFLKDPDAAAEKEAHALVDQMIADNNRTGAGRRVH